ncbi:MAG: HK97 family phage prohead protease [Marivivens sp.]|nr:HK97 family phage prohead protease [Marivivens sp.]NBT50031.1 HK97 family phage prohead protease [Marivivens sp.]NCW67021.1 HK97 family phage prohead protease [Marivivens sp.]NDH01523.1 HK97 family phage prohead protease [Marivivens sp.]
MKIERRNTGTGEVRMEGEGESRRMVGYAAVFYREGDQGTEYRLWDDAVERIMPGAFDGVGDDDVRALFNHDPSLLLGRSTAGTLSLSVDERGLRYEIDPGDTTTARDVQAHLERGDLTGSSFGFRITKEEWQSRSDGPDIRLVRGVELFDVGPVTFPAYESSDAGLRADGDTGEAKASHDKWAAEQAENAKRWADLGERIEAREG